MKWDTSANNIASSLRSGCSRTLAVIIKEASNPYYAIMIDTIHDVAEKNGYTVIVFCTRDIEEQEREAMLIAIGRQVDGVLLFPSAKSSGNLALLRKSGIPFVLISRHMKNPDYDYVICDEEEGGYLAGKHLIDAGHRKLAFFYIFDVIFSSEQRMNGFMRATREAGIPDGDVHLYQYKGDQETRRADAALESRRHHRNFRLLRYRGVEINQLPAYGRHDRGLRADRL